MSTEGLIFLPGSVGRSWKQRLQKEHPELAPRFPLQVSDEPGPYDWVIVQKAVLFTDSCLMCTRQNGSVLKIHRHFSLIHV